MSVHLKKIFSLMKECSLKNLLLVTQHPKTSRDASRNKNYYHSDWKPFHQETVNDSIKVENELSQYVISKVNAQIENKSHGRLFAVVQIMEAQYKVTTEDIIVARKNWAPTAGDRIRLEKVLLVGSSDFTLIGRPLLPLDQVCVIATVIEKTLTHTVPVLTYKPRKNNTRLNFFKDDLTYMRINSINIMRKINKLGDTDGFDNRIF